MPEPTTPPTSDIEPLAPRLRPFARVFLVTAAPAETNAVRAAFGLPPLDPPPMATDPLRGAFESVRSGVGKAAAAAAAAGLSPAARDAIAVLNIGIAGAMPGSGLEIGDAVLATRSVFADDGLITPDGFQPCAAMGFPLIGQADHADISPELVDALSALSDRAGPIATVSTAAGTDARATEIASRTGAIAEAMEGAAVGLVCHRRGWAFAELRVISNTTGDRGGQRWDLQRALDRLTEVVRGLQRGP